MTMEANLPPPPPPPDEPDNDSHRTRYENLDDSVITTKHIKKIHKNDQERKIVHTTSLWFNATTTNLVVFLKGIHQAVLTLDSENRVLPVDPTRTKPLDKEHPPPRQIKEHDKDLYIRGLTLRNSGLSGKVTIQTYTPPDQLKQQPTFNNWYREARIQIQLSQLDSSHRFRAGTLQSYVCRPNMTGIAKLHLTAILKQASTQQIRNFEVQTETLYRGGRAAQLYAVYAATKEDAERIGSTLHHATSKQQGSFFVATKYWHIMSKERKNALVEKQIAFQQRLSSISLRGVIDIDTKVIFGANTSVPPTSLADRIAEEKSNGSYLFKHISPTHNGHTAIWFETGRKPEALAWLLTAGTDLLDIVCKNFPDHMTEERRQSILSSIFNNLEELQTRRREIALLESDGNYMRPSEAASIAVDSIDTLPHTRSARTTSKRNRKPPKKRPTLGLTEPEPPASPSRSKQNHRGRNSNNRKQKATQYQYADVKASHGGKDTLVAIPVQPTRPNVTPNVPSVNAWRSPQNLANKLAPSNSQNANAWSAPPNLESTMAPGLPATDPMAKQKNFDDALSQSLVDTQGEWIEVQEKTKQQATLQQSQEESLDVQEMMIPVGDDNGNESSAHSSLDDGTNTIATQQTKNSNSSNSERLMEEVESLRANQRESLLREWEMQKEHREAEANIRAEARDETTRQIAAVKAEAAQLMAARDNQQQAAQAEFIRRFEEAQAENVRQLTAVKVAAEAETARQIAEAKAENDRRFEEMMQRMVIMETMRAPTQVERPSDVLNTVNDTAMETYTTPTRATAKRHPDEEATRQSDETPPKGSDPKKRRAGNTPPKETIELDNPEVATTPRTPLSTILDSDSIEFGSPYSVTSPLSDRHSPLFNTDEEEASYN